jgi:predicted dehydrogenase
VKAGKHIYCEKPVAVDTATALELYSLCEQAGLKHGVVQDKLWLPVL